MVSWLVGLVRLLLHGRRVASAPVAASVAWRRRRREG